MNKLVLLTTYAVFLLSRFLILITLLHFIYTFSELHFFILSLSILVFILSGSSLTKLVQAIKGDKNENS